MTQLKHAGIETSHKISAVSEYRSTILNDLKLERSQQRMFTLERSEYQEQWFSQVRVIDNLLLKVTIF